MEELVSAFKNFAGLFGAIIAAAFGVMTRHSYKDGGIKWRSLFGDFPFVVFAAILAGGAGEYFGLPELVRYALAGSIGYLSPTFLSEIALLIRQRASRQLGGEDNDDEPEQNT